MLVYSYDLYFAFFFFQAEDGIRDIGVTGVQTCALPICPGAGRAERFPPPQRLAQRPARPPRPRVVPLCGRPPLVADPGHLSLPQGLAQRLRRAATIGAGRLEYGRPVRPGSRGPPL